MITRDSVMDLLVAACPSFAARWNEYRSQPMYEEGLVYIHLGELARHLVECLSAGATSEFPVVFEVVERLHVEGDAYVREAATVGLLEGLQNVASNRGVSPEAFTPFLRTQSAVWWNELNRFWSGTAPYVGADQDRLTK